MRNLLASLLVLFATTAGARLIATPSHQVSAMLKGGKTIKEFILHHYRQAVDEPTINGPMLAAFEPDKKISHLLFLVREKDGRYAPTCGQAHPAYLCIHALR